MRTATVERKTRETEIAVSLDLDGTGECDIDTGIGRTLFLLPNAMYGNWTDNPDR